MMLPAWKLKARQLYWQGVAMPEICRRVAHNVRDVEAALFAKVG